MKHKGPHQFELLKIKGLKRVSDKLGANYEVKRIIYKCMLPDCTTYLNEPALAIGRLCLCWGGCGEAIIIQKDMPVKPMCAKCKERRKQARIA
jgi:hypothetical protein